MNLNHAGGAKVPALITFRKIKALYAKNMKNIFYNAFIITAPVAILILAYLFGMFMIPDDAPLEVIKELLNMNLNMTVNMNIIMCGVMIMAVLIAEEKEKNTLNVLITSTVSGMDFLIANVLTTATVTIICNIAVYFIIGVYGIVPFGSYILITSLGSLAAITFGATIGLLSKNQIVASTIVAPIFLIILIPVFLRDSFFIDNVLYYFFTEQIGRALSELINEGSLSAARYVIITSNLAVFGILFVLCYRKRGLSN